jgi:hypothetical protein
MLLCLGSNSGLGNGKPSANFLSYSMGHFIYYILLIHICYLHIFILYYIL